MSNKREKLWPYRSQFAFLAVPITWACFALVFAAGVRLGTWKSDLGGTVMIVVAVLSVLPLVLVLLDALLVSGAVIDIKGVKLDFSKVQQGRPGSSEVNFQLPSNAGIAGAIVTDSGAMNIAAALELGSTHRIAIVNLRSGDAWWVSRLLVLCSGAVRVGSPELLVFLGKKENVLDCFFGFAKPKDLLKGMLKEEKYRQRYEASVVLSRQLRFYKEYLEVTGVALPVTGALSRYTYVDSPYLKQGEEAAEQILLDQLINRYFQAVPSAVTSGSTEEPPDRLTISRLHELFDPWLCTDHVELGGSDEKQLGQMMDARSEHVALVRGGVYSSVLKKQDGEALILKELVQHE